jgi:membrane protein required for colicin V production
VSAVDIVVLVILGLSAAWGFWRGLTRELVSMIAWVLIAVCAWRWAGALGGAVAHAAGYSSLHAIDLAVGAGLIAIVGLIVAAIAGRLLRSLVSASSMAGADRVMGAVFGALRGGLVVVVLTALTLELGLSGSDPWRHSTSGPWLEKFWHWMAGVRPAPSLTQVQAQDTQMEGVGTCAAS